MTRRAYGYFSQERGAEVSQPPIGMGRSRLLDRDDPIDVERISLERRFEIADSYAAMHPGQPISAFIIETFPELLQAVKKRRPVP